MRVRNLFLAVSRNYDFTIMGHACSPYPISILPVLVDELRK
jgi:hypothetical protein